MWTAHLRRHLSSVRRYCTYPQMHEKGSVSLTIKGYTSKQKWHIASLQVEQQLLDVKNTRLQCWCRCGEKVTSPCWLEFKSVQPSQKAVRSCPIKLKTEMCVAQQSLSCIYIFPQEIKSVCQRSSFSSVFTAVQPTTGKKQKESNRSSLMKEEDVVVHEHLKHPSVVRRVKGCHVLQWSETGIHLLKGHHLGTDRQACMVSLTQKHRRLPPSNSE